MDHCIVLVTVSSETEAKTIAHTLVEERLAACVNIIPGLTSIYRWEENICEDRELLLFIKTQGQKVAALRERIVHLHSYTVPEVIALPIAAGSARYLEWLDNCLTTPPPHPNLGATASAQGRQALHPPGEGVKRVPYR